MISDARSGPSVTVVMVNWNGRAQLERCLPSILRSIDTLGDAGEQGELIIVDNGSTDGSLDLLTPPDAPWALIRNNENLGFSAAVNQGFTRSSAEYVATINNDVVVHDRWLVELLNALRTRANVACAAAQLRYLHQPGRLNSAGISVDLGGRGRDLDDGEPALGRSRHPTPIFGASAGAALYRKAAIEELGGFDERFFAYLEDVDLAWRARRFGWAAISVPTAIVLHEHSATASTVHGLKTYLSVRNHVWSLAKNASRSQLAVAAPFIAALWSWTIILAALRRDTAGLRGLRDGLRGWRQMRQSASGPRLPLRAFARPRLFAYRAADLRRSDAVADAVEPEIAELARGH